MKHTLPSVLAHLCSTSFCSPAQLTALQHSSMLANTDFCSLALFSAHCSFLVLKSPVTYQKISNSWDYVKILADHKKMVIIATQDYKAFYSFKASTWHKALESTRLLKNHIPPQLSLPVSTHILRKRSCHNSTFIDEHNSYSVCISFAYTAR